MDLVSRLTCVFVLEVRNDVLNIRDFRTCVETKRFLTENAWGIS